MAVGTWRRIIDDGQLQRSSHNASVVGDKVYVFGGELIPREPRDNQLFEIKVNADGTVSSSANLASTTKNTAPSPRVGSGSVTLNGKLYFFSGRGGIAMKPIEEQGSLYEYDPSTSSWNLVGPADSSASFPPARSYHCMASDGKSQIFIHAGCPESGRLADLWAFDINSKEWTQLPDAPPPQRGGPSIAQVDGKLYRMNGFDGKTEQGGSLDVYDISSKKWSTITFNADGKDGPEARSVGALVPVCIDDNWKLITLFGERDPSSLGHAGAGKMLSDWWMFDISSQKWEQGITNTNSDTPAARGWFDAATLGNKSVVVVGGLDESNERLGDVWILEL